MDGISARIAGSPQNPFFLAIFLILLIFLIIHWMRKCYRYEFTN